VLGEALLIVEGGGVDPLHRGFRFVALPVGGGASEDLDRLDDAARGNVRALTKLVERAQPITGDDVAALLVDELLFEGLAELSKARHRVPLSDFLALERDVLRRELLHLLLDLLEVLGVNGRGTAKS
jgi:hypothetical protein